MNGKAELMEKALLLLGGVAAGYALKEVIDDVIENMDSEKLGPIVQHMLEYRKEG